jgi:Putative lumazine-binding
MSAMHELAELKALRAAVQDYFDGFAESDAAKLEALFLPSSALTAVIDGEVAIEPRDAWLARVRTRKPLAEMGLARFDEVLALDLISPTLAHVKVRCQMPPRYFTDILSFVKLDGRWRVAQKVYSFEVRE